MNLGQVQAAGAMPQSVTLDSRKHVHSRRCFSTFTIVRITPVRRQLYRLSITVIWLILVPLPDIGRRNTCNLSMQAQWARQHLLCTKPGAALAGLINILIRNFVDAYEDRHRPHRPTDAADY